MKKISLFLCLAVVSTSWGYTSTDIKHAEHLAGKGYIVQRGSASEYDLDRAIFRQEAIGIALKMQGATLPDGYTCKGYYQDVTALQPNNWACRAVEIAADQGLVTRANQKFRPEDTISMAETIAIVMKALGMETSTNSAKYTYADGVVDWQKPYIAALYEQGIIKSTSSFAANSLATRAEVFELSTGVSKKQNPEYDSFQKKKSTTSRSFFSGNKPKSYTRTTSSKKTPVYVKYKNR